MTNNHHSISMNAIARWQHGNGAKAALTGDHAYDWKAIKPDNSLHSLDLQGYFDQYSRNYRVVQTGLGKYNGWAVFNPFEMQNQHIVQLSIVMSNEMTHDNDAVHAAILRYRINWRYALDWTYRKLGRTFTLSDKVHLVIVSKSPEQLLELARSTNESSKRGDLLWYCRDQYITRYRRVSPNIMYAHALYTGHHPDEDFGSANSGNHLALSSDNTSVAVDWAMQDAKSRRIAYDTIHELYHGFGCPHPTEADGPGWQHDIMYWGEPEEAEIIPATRSILMQSPYLK